MRRQIDLEISVFIDFVGDKYNLENLSPLIFDSIKEYLLREGKRVRPLLFLLSYKGYATPGPDPKNLFRSAIGTELLHAFLLIHDDIVDRSQTRRGLPSAHRILAEKTANLPFLSFGGEDLAIILGDIVYSMAIEAFLSVETNPKNKEKALLAFVESAFLTGCGEFIEMLAGAKALQDVSEETVLSIYDYKTAYYTFVSPLLAGAILAEAPMADLKKLKELGLSLGRAFQINDDILGIFGEEEVTGKSSLTDLAEKKKTLLLLHAYNNADKELKLHLDNIIAKNEIGQVELELVRKIMLETGSLIYARRAIEELSSAAISILDEISLDGRYRLLLTDLVKKVLPSG